MVGVRAGHDLEAPALSAHTPVGTRQLEGDVVGLAAARGEREARIRHGHERAELGGQPRDRLVGEARLEAHEVELPDLVRDGVRHRSAAVTDLADTEADAGVQRAVAVLVEEVGALRADDHARIGAREGLIERGEIAREMAYLCLDRVAEVRVDLEAAHWTVLLSSGVALLLRRMWLMPGLPRPSLRGARRSRLPPRRCRRRRPDRASPGRARALR